MKVNDTVYITNELVTKAQQGDQGSLNLLAELARPRLFEYVFRHTQCESMTEDIVQESLIKMVKVLGKLERADRFWPWLRKIAFGGMCDEYNRNRREPRSISGGAEVLEDRCEGGKSEKQTGLGKMVAQELQGVVLAAMRELKPRQRDVLIMRCYEDMEYASIAEQMGCSEFAVRMLFWRAKKSLQKQLSKSGLGKGALLMALVAFGKMTAQSEAAAGQISVTAATLKVGAMAGGAAMAGTKAGLVTLAAAGVIGVGAGVSSMMPGKAVVGPEVAAVKQVAESAYGTTAVAADASEGVGEWWYFYPDGAGGPVWTRLWQWDDKGGARQWRWLQNSEMNCYFERGSNTLHVVNHRMWNSDLSVRRLPSDSGQLTEFLNRIEGRSADIEYVSDNSRNMWVIAKRSAAESWTRVQQNYQYEVMEKERFQPTTPSGGRQVDNRDAMHKRGWTYFRIEGEIDGQQVVGMGRMPFVYATSREYWPWLRLRVGGEEFVDSSFVGLSRPWMGLHTIDTVRRDAAGQGTPFETQLRKEGAGVEAKVVLTTGEVELVYTIDMERDVIEKIEMKARGTRHEAGVRGELRFVYMQDISEMDQCEFVEPRPGRLGNGEKLETLWLFNLAGKE